MKTRHLASATLTALATVVALSGGASAANSKHFVDELDLTKKEVLTNAERVGSIDMGVLVAVMKDRLQLVSARAAADAIAEAGSGQSLVVNELLRNAAELVSATGEVGRRKIDRFAIVFLRALTAEALVRTLLTDPKIGAAETWKDAGITWTPPAPPLDGAAKQARALRAHVVDWAYHRLGALPAFGGDPGQAPSCKSSTSDDAARSLCNAITAKVEAARAASTGKTEAARAAALAEAEKERAVSLDGLFKITVMRAAVAAGAELSKGSFDLATVAKAAAAAEDVADLASGQLSPGTWKQLKADTEVLLRELKPLEDALFQLTDAIKELRDASVPKAEKLPAVKEAAKTALAQIAVVEKSPKVGKLTGAAADRLREVLTAIDTLVATDPAPDIEKALAPFGSRLRDARTWLSTAADAYADLASWLATVKGVTTTLDGLPLTSAALFASKADAVASAIEYMPAALGPLLGSQEALRNRLVAAQSAFKKTALAVRALGLAAGAMEVNATCKNALDVLRLLVAADGSVPVADALGGVLASLSGQTPKPSSALALLKSVNLATVTRALGWQKQPSELCAGDGEGSAGCWVVRVLEAFKEAIVVDNEGSRVDGTRLATSLATVGDDFRRHHSWRGYFHLTIGLGGVYSRDPPKQDAQDGTVSSRAVPLAAEQIGLGLASPSFGKDRVTFKVGLFASGLLYRVVLNNVESKAFFFGGLAAFDLYEAIELFAAPAMLVYPPSGDTSHAVRGAFLFGVQVPLGDYLAKL